MTPLLVSVMYILSEPVGPGNKQLWFRRKIMQTVSVFFFAFRFCVPKCPGTSARVFLCLGARCSHMKSVVYLVQPKLVARACRLISQFICTRSEFLTQWKPQTRSRARASSFDRIVHEVLKKYCCKKKNILYIYIFFFFFSWSIEKRLVHTLASVQLQRLATLVFLRIAMATGRL